MTKKNQESETEPTWADVAQASAEQDDTETKKGTMRLPCPLSEHELAERGVEHARGTIAMAAYEEETKALLKSLKEERAEGLAALSGPVKKLAEELDTKQVVRDVPVTFCKSFRQNRKWIVRMDTGEELSGDYAPEPLTSADRQQGLALDDSDEAAEADELDDYPEDGVAITEPGELLSHAADEEML